jgi:uncharacterized protein YqgC (DUF456 family)
VPAGELAAWVLVLLLVALGLAGIVVPALPGTALVLAGLALGAWIDGFARVGTGTVALLAALAVLSYGVELGAAALGAKKSGASRQAVTGAALGTLAGIFFGLPGILLGPFAGAVLGEYAHRRDLEQAGRAGLGAWIGFALGVAGKIAITFSMIGIFAGAYFFWD